MSPDALPPPGSDEALSTSTEVLRVWIDAGRLRVSSNDRVWDNPVYYGYMLGEVAKHYIKAISNPQKKKLAEDTILKIVSDRLGSCTQE